MRKQGDIAASIPKRPASSPGLRLGAFMEAVERQRHHGGREGRRAGAANVGFAPPA
jgi:hypothetical protein